MTTASGDLWPEDLESLGGFPPAAVLREQAAHLSRRTEELVEGSVESWSVGDKIRHAFILTVPRLGGYRYELLTLTHGVEIFPIEAEDDLGVSTELKDEKDFLNWLQTRLSSARTRRVVGNLIAQVRPVSAA